MIDKTLRKSTAERHGPVVVVRYTGGGDCLWLNMYLDCEHGQMTCDSDIGSYSYRWGRCANKGDDFLRFCTEWLANEEWLLRKCIGENHEELAFDRHETVLNLRKDYDDIHNSGDEEYDVDCSFDEVLDIANGYDNKDQFIAALSVLADERGVELPDEWWSCIVEHYTPQQKRFAEICREVIVPELKRLTEGQIAPSKPSVKEIQNTLMAAKDICCGTECKLCPLAVRGVCFTTASSLKFDPDDVEFSVTIGPAYPEKWFMAWDGGSDDENA